MKAQYEREVEGPYGIEMRERWEISTTSMMSATECTAEVKLGTTSTHLAFEDVHLEDVPAEVREGLIAKLDEQTEILNECIKMIENGGEA